MRQETINILEGATDSNLLDFGHSNFFLDMSLEVRKTEVKMNYWHLIKIKTFCTEKKTINKIKRQPMEWEIFANGILDRRLVSQIYKEFTKLNQKPNDPVKK